MLFKKNIYLDTNSINSEFNNKNAFNRCFLHLKDIKTVFLFC